MDQRDGGGDPNEQFHRNEAISAVVDEGFLGEDDDEDYEDLYNDVNVGEGFLQSVKKNEDQVENKVELVESKDDVFSRVEVGFDVKLDGNEMVEKGSGEGRVDLGQSLVKDEVETESRTEGNDGVPNIGMGQQQQQSHHVGNAGGDGLSRQGSANMIANANVNVNGSVGNVYGNGGGGGGGMNVAGGGNGGGMNIGSGGGGGGGTGTGTVLFVGDLHWWTTDAELESELCKYGQVKEVKFFDEKASGKSKGYCQVEFYDPSAAIACKEGMNGHVFNGRPCVVAFASPYSVKRMGEAQVNRNQQMAQSSAGQVKRGPGDVPGKPGGVGSMPAGGNFQGGADNNNNNNRGYGRGNWGRGNGQGMAGRGGRGGRGMMGNGGNGFGPPHMMHPQSMMGQGFDPSFGGPMGRMGGYGGFPGGPTPPFSGMMPSFPPVGNVGLPGLAPHVNPAFFGRGMPMNGMGMMPAGGADGNMGMWSDPNMSGWNGDEHGGRVGESSYGEEAASDQQFGEGSHDRGDWPNPAKEKDRRHRDDRDREVGYERDLPREKGVHEEEWPERRHRDEREQRERSRDRDRDRERERSRDRDRDRDRERSRDRDRGRDRHRDERDRYADHHRYRDVEPEYDDEWDRGRSSRGHGKSRLAPEDEHRSRSRDADYGKKRRVTAE